MAEENENGGSKVESVIEKVSEKIHGDDSSSSSDSDSETVKPASPSSVKAKIFRLFGREKPVHQVFLAEPRQPGSFLNCLSITFLPWSATF